MHGESADPAENPLINREEAVRSVLRGPRRYPGRVRGIKWEIGVAGPDMRGRSKNGLVDVRHHHPRGRGMAEHPGGDRAGPFRADSTHVRKTSPAPLVRWVGTGTGPRVGPRRMARGSPLFPMALSPVPSPAHRQGRTTRRGNSRVGPFFHHSRG
ncbi:hypothetical protein GCM10027160_18320 [Streptomyces calidiresistens]